jgi:hypothetical protein
LPIALRAIRDPERVEVKKLVGSSGEFIVKKVGLCGSFRGLEVGMKGYGKLCFSPSMRTETGAMVGMKGEELRLRFAYNYTTFRQT